MGEQVPFENGSDPSFLFKRLERIERQVETLGQQLELLARRSQHPSGAVRQVPKSPTMQLAFFILKSFFLAGVGAGVVCVLSAALGMSAVTPVLLDLIRQLAIPSIALAFCAIALAVVAESIK